MSPSPLSCTISRFPAIAILTVVRPWIVIFIATLGMPKVMAESSTDAPVSPSHDGVIVLPPMIVETQAGQPWSIARLPNVEILSRCSEEQTKNVIDRYQRLLAMLEMVYPTHLQPDLDIPAVLIVDDGDLQTSSRQLADIIQERATGGALSSRINYMTNFHLWDMDTQVIYFLLSGHGSTGTSITLTPVYVRYLLETRTPALPRWFIEGTMTLLDNMMLTVPPVAPPRISTTTFVQPKPVYPYDIVTALPFIWITPEETKKMHSLVKRTARAQGRAFLPKDFPFMPLEKILTLPSLEGLSTEEIHVFAHESALLIRWLLDPNPQELRLRGQVLNVGKPSAKHLWQFVERSATTTGTPKLFFECFGQTIEDVEDRLRAYLPFACLNQSIFKIEPATKPVIHEPKIQTAKALDVAILKGRLERLESNYVRTHHRHLVPEYELLAKNTMQRVSTEQATDPYLLAEKGLLEVDSGNDIAARPLLAEAVNRQIKHPRVYFELARISYAQLRAANFDPTTIATELEAITDTLLQGLQQKPPLPTSYALLYEIWLRHNTPLTPIHIALLNEGASRFPHHFRIVYPATLFHLAHGNTPEAEKLITRSLDFFYRPEERNRFEQLRQMIITATSTPVTTP